MHLGSAAEKRHYDGTTIDETALAAAKRRALAVADEIQPSAPRDSSSGPPKFVATRLPGGADAQCLLEEFKAKEQLRSAIRDRWKELQNDVETTQVSNSHLAGAGVAPFASLCHQNSTMGQGQSLSAGNSGAQPNLASSSFTTIGGPNVGAAAFALQGMVASSISPPGSSSALTSLESSDAFASFCRAMITFLRGIGHNLPCLLSRVASAPIVQAEWSNLQQSRLVGKSTKMKQVLIERQHLFELGYDVRGQPTVRLNPKASSSELLQASLSAPPLVTSTTNSVSTLGELRESCAVQTSIADGLAFPRVSSTFSGSPIGTLRQEQVTAIEAHLRRNGGQDRVSRIGSLFGVRKAQLLAHFSVTNLNDGPLVSLLDGQHNPKAPSFSLMGPVINPAHDTVEKLEQMVTSLIPSRNAVGNAMAFCIDNAEQHAATIARKLLAAFGEPGLRTDAALARLYLVNDVLQNSGCGKTGAMRFNTSFQELLPDACEQLGRVWFRRIECHKERTRGENGIRKVLSAWQAWSAFPPLFTKGLEALLFAPVLDTSPDAADQEFDICLRKKLLRWFAAADQARLPYASRLRGLSGKALPTAACRARLCHFERYWHRPGVEFIDEMGDPFEGDSVSVPSSPKQTAPAPTFEHASNSTGSLKPGSVVSICGLKSSMQFNGALATVVEPDLQSAGWRVCLDNGSMCVLPMDNLLVLAAADEIVRDREPLDGDPLTPEELAEVEAIEASEQFQHAGYNLDVDQIFSCAHNPSGIWEEVCSNNLSKSQFIEDAETHAGLRGFANNL